jgi:hypothetical protein
MYTIALKPRAPLLLTQELNVSQLQLASKEIELLTIKGINVYPWPAKLNAQCSLFIYMSTIEFFINGKPQSDFSCNKNLITDSDGSTSIFVSVIAQIIILNQNTFNSAPVCPFLFKNSRLSKLELYGQVDSFLYKQLLRFQQVVDNDTTIDSKFDELDISGYNYKLDTGILHPLVFEIITSTTIYNTVALIQTDLFKNFKHLNTIILNLDSLSNFYHQIGIEWIMFLPKTGVLIKAFQYEVQSYLQPLYTYPDKDLCSFSSFPQNRSIYFCPFMNDVLVYNSCTITLKWLGRHYYNNASADTNLAFVMCNMSQGQSDSEIDDKLKLCKVINSRNESYQVFTDFYQVRILNMFVIELIPFVLIPFFCLLGLFLNRKIIQTIKKNQMKELKEDFYKYMNANAKFNCLYCLIFVFYPINNCNWQPNYYFCSSIYTYLVIQYFKIVMISYVGESFKMCASISYLMMTLNRYLLIGKDHGPWLVKAAKLKYKRVIQVSLLLSFLINIGHIFEFKPIEDVLYSPLKDSFNYNTYPVSGYSYSIYPIPNNGFAFSIYTIVYFILSFVAFFFINTGLEVMIVRRMRKEIKEKRQRLAQMSAVSAANGSRNQHDRKKVDEDEKKERRVIKMVIINGVLNFILRSPDLLVFLENLNVWGADKTAYFGSSGFGVLVPGILNLIVDLGYFAYILTFSTNFIIFYKFNSKFKEAVVFFETKKLSIK